MTYAKSGLFWSQCFLPSLVIRKAQAGAGKSSLGLLWFHQCKPDHIHKECGTHQVSEIHISRLFFLPYINGSGFTQNRNNFEE